MRTPFPNPRINDQHGFTLIELLILIAIIGIVVAASAPSMRSLIDNNRVSAYVNSLVGAARYAKSEAVFRNKEVTLCVTGCGPKGGWAVSDLSGLLKSGSKPNAGIEISGAQKVVFTPDGSLLGEGFTLNVIMDDVKTRTIDIGSAGSISSSVLQEQAE